ncbi:cysteine desulfurase family protein [Paenibacillus sp. y28]|uniref:cysteine desulfurase family protein n=1 Tax=Paenibacillus sp. y28 TaxID=3129110 RepID=UPI003017DEB4
MLYFDHCATTPVDEEVLRAVTEVMRTAYGNPSALHKLGVEAERLVNKARSVIAGQLSVRPEEIIFTSGGTESNNLAVKGAAYYYRSRGTHLITTRIEHPSVMEPFRQLEEEGFQVTYLDADQSGAASVAQLAQALRPDTILVSMMHVNNETGRIQPVAEAGALLKAYPRILFHVDAVQSIGKLPLALSDWGIDLCSISAHKIRGPKGAGVLYRRNGVQLRPLLAGGGQEQGARSGTENVPLIVGTAKAVRLACERQPAAALKLRQLRRQLLDLLAREPRLVYNGSLQETDMAPQVVNVSAPGLKAEAVVHALEELGICISTKSACSSGKEEPSSVLLAMGADRQRAVSPLRISLSEAHEPEQIQQLAAKLSAALDRVAAVSR